MRLRRRGGAARGELDTAAVIDVVRGWRRTVSSLLSWCRWSAEWHLAVTDDVDGEDLVELRSVAVVCGERDVFWQQVSLYALAEASQAQGRKGYCW
ncbi:pollen-specific leucine-rich repeat extensin-like protein 3 [Iris pallida]|uniref:Pollen-specific leucine-rich repeat extensin-like protein 3 n=1 Tax=Iris pallida TaxID=29817 RepID=A0AAX6FU18_IRIPA|nr:pollen-specific leucine-rich repeat extensin-like protein 3 [Iris pallida]KAJ6837070.1 pollen-specific leucine-rich repeat extensin-like protein 3 [Iris pallida]